MSKKNKSSQFPPAKLPQAPAQLIAPQPLVSKLLPVEESTVLLPPKSSSVRPEQTSLSAHRHIQTYLNGQPTLAEDDLTAVLRLSQHLRVFGLLSAVGYVNQSNDQNGRVRQRTVPVWESLLGQLVDEQHPPKRQALMAQVVAMAQNEPEKYMATWRRSLVLAQHWNFWARAYKE
jgi:hypothetical protein